MHRIRPYIPALVFLAGCAIVWHPHAQVEAALAEPLTTIMPTLDGYTVHDQVVSDEERKVAGMSDYVARVYAHDTVAAFTTLVSYYDHQAQGKTIHSPRNCLPGAGWEILRSGTRVVATTGGSHTVNHYVLKNGSETAVAYYWYQGRGRIVANEYAVKWNLLRDAAFSGRTEEALVRVVVPVDARRSATGDSAAADRALADADAIGDKIASRLMFEVTRVLPGKKPVTPVS